MEHLELVTRRTSIYTLRRKSHQVKSLELDTPLAQHVETISPVIPISVYKIFLFEYRKVVSVIILGVRDSSAGFRGTARVLEFPVFKVMITNLARFR